MVSALPGPEAAYADESEAFDAALRRRDGLLDVRPERPCDRDALRLIFAHCSPLASTLPASMLIQQADLQEIGHRAQHPGAMRRIAWRGDTPIGRIVIDWRVAGPRTDVSQCVDIAVLPAYRPGGAGLHMLRAWLDIADLHRRVCRLEVRHGNPAILLYRRLGFAPSGPATSDDPVMTMIRPRPRG